jgi:hypothetical protein
MWADVLDAHTPNAAEMAAAEAELQELGEVAPLPAADVDALVEVATKTPSVVVEGRGVVGTVLRARRLRQPLLQVAAAVLLLMTVAWVARELVWAEGKDPNLTLDYATAIKLATQPGRDDFYYRSALAPIVNDCGKAAETLHSLADQGKYPNLAAKSLIVSAELVALLTKGPSAPSGPIEGSLVAACADSVNEHLTVEEREKALDHVRDLAKSGLTAVWLAPLAGDEAKAARDNAISRLLRTLPR